MALLAPEAVEASRAADADAEVDAVDDAGVHAVVDDAEGGYPREAYDVDEPNSVYAALITYCNSFTLSDDAEPLVAPVPLGVEGVPLAGAGAGRVEAAVAPAPAAVVLGTAAPPNSDCISCCAPALTACPCVVWETVCRRCSNVAAAATAASFRSRAGRSGVHTPMFEVGPSGADDEGVTGLEVVLDEMP